MPTNAQSLSLSAFSPCHRNWITVILLLLCRLYSILASIYIDVGGFLLVVAVVSYFSFKRFWINEEFFNSYEWEYYDFYF